jgi:hypothetical protein
MDDDDDWDARRREMLLDIAYRHNTTAWEVHQMMRLCVFGPDAVDNPMFDPREELEMGLYRVEELLAERPSIPELLTIYQSCHDVVVALIERQTDPDRRAKWTAALIEQEARMEGLRQRLGITAADMEEKWDFVQEYIDCSETIHLRAGFLPKKKRARRA